jgi:hypothetical protein
MREELGTVEANDAVAPLFLRYVQRVIGGPHQRIDIGDPCVWPPGHATTDRALDAAAVERKCMLLHRFPHPFRERHGLLGSRPGKDQHEFLAAVPANAIDLPSGLLEHPGQLSKHRVTRLVAMGIVHALEPVEIAHDARKRFLQPDRVLERFLETLLEMAPVVDPRQ